MEKIKQIFAIYGASGCGRGLAPFVQENIKKSKNTKLIFIDDDLSKKKVDKIDVFNYRDFKNIKLKKKKVLIGISHPKTRKKIFQKLQNDNISFFSLKSKNSILLSNHFGYSTAISPFSSIMKNVKIGKAFHLNLYSYVEHDCTVGDFVTFAPGVRCNGNVEIGDNVYIGSGVIIKNGNLKKKIIIGKNSVIGAGSVVTKNIKPNMIVAGNPAKPIK